MESIGNANKDPFVKVENSPLTISKEWEDHKPTDMLGVATLVAIVAIAVISALAFVLCPVWAGITTAVVGALAITFMVGKEFLKSALLPSSIHGVFKSASYDRNSEGLKNYKVNTTFKCSDGEILRGSFISKYDENTFLKHTPLENRKLTICLHGNAMVANQKTLTDLSTSLHTDNDVSDYIEMNYRGAGTGFVPKQTKIINDFQELVIALERQGYRRENITLFGHSIGGTVAIKLKQALDRSNPNTKVKLIAHNTLFNMTKLAKTFVPKSIERLVPTFVKSAGWDYQITADEWKEFGNDAEVYQTQNDAIVDKENQLAIMLRENNIKQDVNLRLYNKGQGGHNFISLCKFDENG